jgi:MFS family permease
VSRRKILAGAVLAGAFLSEFGFALLFLPLIQRYLPIDRHLSLALPGYALSAYGAARLVAQVPFGGIADTLHDRLVFGLGYLVVLLSGLVLWAPVPVVLLLLASVAYGAGHALADPLIPAALVAHAEGGTHGRAMSLLSLVQIAGLGAGVGGGAFIVDFAPPAAGFVLVAVANGLALLLLTVSAVRGAPQTEGATLLTTIGGWRRALTARPVLWLFGVFLAIGLATNVLSPDLTPFIVRQLHSSLHVMVLYMIPTGIAAVGSLWLGGWVADHFGRVPPLLAGAAIAAGAFAVLTRVNQPWEGAIVGVFVAGGLAMTMPTSTAALLDEVSPDHTGIVLGGMMSVQGLAQAGGPFLGGLAIAGAGVAIPMAIAAAGCWLAVPMIVLYARCPRDGSDAGIHSKRFARYFGGRRQPQHPADNGSNGVHRATSIAADRERREG